MLATLITQIIITGAGTEILRYFNRPNTLLFEEERKSTFSISTIFQTSLIILASSVS